MPAADSRRSVGGQSGPHRQQRLGPLQSVNLRCLVEAADHRAGGGIQVQPDHVVAPLLGLGVGNEGFDFAPAFLREGEAAGLSGHGWKDASAT